MNDTRLDVLTIGNAIVDVRRDRRGARASSSR